MNGRLLTRRMIPALVAALSLGVVGTAQATTTGNVSPSGVLTITGGPEDNYITAYQIAPEPNATGAGTHQVIIVHDGDAETKPICEGCPEPLNIAQLTVFPGAGCEIDPADPPVPGDSTTGHTLKCTVPAGTGSTGENGGNFTEVIVNGGDGADAFSETLTFAGLSRQDGQGRATRALGVPTTLNGDAGSDFLLGTIGNDTINGGAGNDTLFGMNGEDTLYPNAGSNEVYGGTPKISAGAGMLDESMEDKVDLSDQTGDQFITLDNNSNDGTGCSLNSQSVPQGCQNQRIDPTIEHLTTGAGNDQIAASLAVNEIDTGAGNDRVYGGGGADTIIGAAGQNTIYGDFGPATFSAAVTLPKDGGTEGADTITAGNDGNTVVGGNETGPLGDIAGDSITTGSGTDTIDGQAGNDNIFPGDAAANTVQTTTGGTGIDLINSNTGATASAAGTANGGVDHILAGAGADQVVAGNGDNEVDLGPGADTSYGTQNTVGNGKDKVYGGSGDDTIKDGGGDNPEIDGDEGEDTITVGSGNDFVYGGHKGQAALAGDLLDHITDSGGNNTVVGDLGNDEITTAGGVDMIWGGPEGTFVPADGSDNLTSGAGNDTIIGGSEADTMDGQADSDTISYEEKVDPVWAVVVPAGTPAGPGVDSGTFCDPYNAPPVGKTCELDKISNAENLKGGSAADVLGGDKIVLDNGVLKCVSPATNNFVNTLTGNGGTDSLFGCDGNDELFGEAGDDNLVGGVGNDKIHGGSGDEAEGDSVSFQDYRRPNGETTGNGVQVTLGAGTGYDDGPRDDASQRDELFGDIENVTGSDYDDLLTGSGQRNKLDGLDGKDLLDGGAGPDRLIGGLQEDTVTYVSRTSDITVTLDNVYDTTTRMGNDGAVGEGDDVTRDVENLTGGSGNDTFVAQAAITGDAGHVANKLVGNDGNDSFDGKAGADDFNGGNGTDTVVYSDRSADELVTVTMVDDQPNDGSSQQDSTNGALDGEMDNVRPNNENLTGGDEPDSFSGDTGANTIIGNGGADLLDGLPGDDVLEAGAGNDELLGRDGDDVLSPGLGNDEVFGGAGTNTVDYSERTTPVVVTTQDNEPNDGEVAISEADNVHNDVSRCKPSCDTTGASPDPGPDPGPGPGPGPDPGPGPGQVDNTNANSNTTTNTTTNTTNTGSSNDTTTTKVDTTTEQKDPADSATVRPSSMQTSVSVTKAVKGIRSVLVRGRILVKARDGVAKASAACKRGGKVRVTIRKGRKVVGKKLVKVSRRCTFLAPVALKKGTAGKLKVEVRFLGNRALKPTKRTTSLQVNG